MSPDRVSSDHMSTDRAGSELEATVARPAEGDADGELLLDDLTRLPFAAEAVQAEVLRLRSGQRVRVRTDGGQVRALTLVGLRLAP